MLCAMNRIILFALLSFSFSVNATLIDRGGGLLYDDELDITWLADFNPSKSIGSDLVYFWDDAVTFIDNFTYHDPIRNTVWDDWRLPTQLEMLSLYRAFHRPTQRCYLMSMNVNSVSLAIYSIQAWVVYRNNR